ncbi:DUF4397 domain-containing protein [Demequina sp. TTPB684]|uniref:DUF4397 domain-containing protein n=1 Tax=unclassified Demequina TaxID=2620311 RepID=UPI001CF5F154|nr:MULTISPECIES: DUF4397 domain-containing protein [unclassified Demequina]MCB2411626.1 DUF4397 domain-containing protein [Demequina sp. TTPB684]UPU88285.1 DUF4397 domain-containing protein [Demequina sp. TMPB413]
MRRQALAAFAAGALGLAIAVPAGATTAEDETTLTAVNALPDTAIDLYNQDEILVDDFEPGTVVGPMPIEPGEIEVTAAAPDAPDNLTPIIGPALTSLEEGGHVSVVAYLTDEGVPALASFEEDVKPTVVTDGARLVVRHVASAPAVDVLVDGTALASGVMSGDDVAEEVTAGDYALSVASAETGEELLSSGTLTLETDQVTTVYVYGSAEDDSLALLTTTRDVVRPDAIPDEPTATASASPSASPTPSVVPDDGITTDTDGTSPWWWLVAGLVLIAVIAAVAIARASKAGNDPVSGDGRGPEEGPGPVNR